MIAVLLPCRSRVDSRTDWIQVVFTPDRLALAQRRLSTLKKGFGSGPTAEEERYACYWPARLQLEASRPQTRTNLIDEDKWIALPEPYLHAHEILERGPKVDAFNQMVISAAGVAFLASHDHVTYWASDSLDAEQLTLLSKLLQ